MNIPTVEQALAALDASPQAAREFEQARAIESPGMSRRAAVAKALEALRAKRAATASADTASELKARARKAAVELEKTAAALRQRKAAAPAPKTTLTKPSAAIAKPAAKAKPALAETERDKLKAQYARITDPVQKRAFRLRWWNELAGQITAPEPRKSNK
jgi:glucan-binding YG repeat protein